MKNLLEKIVRFRNPTFHFDSHLSASIIISFFFINILAMLRGLKLVFLGKNPKNALLSSNTKFIHSGNIRFGSFLKLGESVVINALCKDGVHLGNNVSIGSYSQLIGSTTFNNIGKGIQIGDNVGIGEFAYLGGAGGLKIGSDCIIGQYFSCHPENHNFKQQNIAIKKQGTTRKGIHIGKDCWIGSRVSVLDGVTIGNHCVIAAGSVVNKSFPDGSIIGGVPAKLLKSKFEANENYTSKHLCSKSL